MDEKIEAGQADLPFAKRYEYKSDCGMDLSAVLRADD